MKLLAIDTATEACSASLSDGDTIRTQYQLAPRKHAELILPMVRTLLDEAGLELQGLDAIAFGQGPGAFTGVRIAAGVVQGLAFASGKPVVPVSSLAAMAQAAAAEHEFIFSAFDARMEEIYYGFYRTGADGLVRPVGEEGVVSPSTIRLPMEANWFGLGSGFRTYPEILQSEFGDHLRGFSDDVYPCSEHIVPLAIDMYDKGMSVEAAQAHPVYLRNQVTG
ncbi:MAG: tRNA (adenosine(37)-N6)-threonylcarbamoyltransferase complex dimerization subunit type 1 TsaB, partial [Pirellulales bacterium]|nr:tRNA (adenosine(37)-N6)-threonylcarbamoyltransferase complex dimerization subunit type 1 TsaB [Pirellulales bacterium]